MNSHNEEHSLSQALEEFIIPQAKRWGMAKIFVACPDWKRNMEAPEGMKITRRPLRGARVPKRGGRPYGASAMVDAEWLEDKMESARAPKLCFVLGGTAALRIADYVVHGKPGHGILLSPGMPFANGSQSWLDETQPQQNRCEILMMLPYQSGLLCWISRNWRDSQGESHVVEETSSIPHSQVSFYLNRLTAEATGSNLHRRAVCDSLLNVALALLHRELQQLPVMQTGECGVATNLAPTKEKEYSIAQAQEYIHHNLREPISIDKVARAVCMSRTVFTAQFRAQTGKPFAQFVTDIRFEEAAKILQETDLAVLHVASLVGLKPCRMRTLFQERKGVSPTQFRQGSRREYSRPPKTG